jgi:pimeloyl-ACP methyl ester carboxylesterase
LTSCYEVIRADPDAGVRAGGKMSRHVRAGASTMRTSVERVTTDDGVRLAASMTWSNDDAPGLVLVHGFGGAKEDFADHVEALAREQRVVVFDHRGHGESDAPDEASAYSINRLTADTLAVASEYGLDTFRLLGHSLGGMVAQRVVLEHPGRVDALVLMNTSAGPPPGIDPELICIGAQIALTDGMDVLRELLDAYDPLASPAHERVVAERPGFEEYGARKWAALSAAMWSAIATDIATQPDGLSALADVSLPTLVLVGEQDESFIEASFQLADVLPDARLVVIPDAGHSPQFENPSAWYAAVSGFLNERPV